jgi:hypothetical protein
LPEVGRTEEKHLVSWNLKVCSGNFSACFEIPVYVTDDSKEKVIDENIDKSGDYNNNKNHDTENLPDEIDILHTESGGIKYSFNHEFSSISTTYAIKIYLFLSIFTYFFTTYGVTDGSNHFRIICILLSIILVSFIFFKRALISSIEIEDSNIFVKTEVFSKVIWKSLVPFSNFKKINIMPIESNSKKTFYDLQILKIDLFTVKAGGKIKNKKTAELLVSKIEKEINKRASDI